MGFYLIDLRELVEGMHKVSKARNGGLTFGLRYLIDMADDRTFEAWVVIKKLRR